MSKEFNLKEYIRAALELQPHLQSKDIVAFLKKKGYVVSWQTVAGIKGSLNK